MTRIMHICVVLVVMVSVFFYAPIEVRAEEVVSLSTATDISSTGLERYICENKGVFDSRTYDFSSYLDGDGLYKITFNFSASYYCLSELGSYPFWLNAFTCMNTSDSFYQMSSSSSDWQREFNYSNNNFTIYLNSDAPVVQIAYFFVAVFQYNVAPTVDFSMNYSISDIVATKVLDEDSEDYQNGYNAGYSAGESVGYGNGYSQGFTDGEASVDTDAIYDEAFQAGKDSVDTDSYYDAGYQDGYQVAYSEGYESGYDVGYQDAMDRIANWGADISDYPVLKYSFFDDELQLICDVFTSAPSTSYDSALLCYLDFDINPNHTYKFVVRTGGTTGGTYDALYSEYKLNFVIGSNVINATNNVGKTFNFFIPGYNMGSSILFEAFVYDCVYYGGVSEEDGFLKHMGQVYPTLKNCYIDIYDMGPSGDTQNHIANQTDQLTNGYDSSQGAAVNDDFKASVNEYHTAEDSLFSTATTSLENFTFLDFTSITGMVTSLSFVTSIMTSIYMAMGGDTGASGIILAVLFSVMLVSMAIGLYRYYVSNGKSDGSGKGGD